MVPHSSHPQAALGLSPGASSSRPTPSFSPQVCRRTGRICGQQFQRQKIGLYSLKQGMSHAREDSGESTGTSVTSATPRASANICSLQAARSSQTPSAGPAWGLRDTTLSQGLSDGQNFPDCRGWEAAGWG